MVAAQWLSVPPPAGSCTSSKRAERLRVSAPRAGDLLGITPTSEKCKLGGERRRKEPKDSQMVAAWVQVEQTEMDSFGKAWSSFHPLGSETEFTALEEQKPRVLRRFELI
ncbi:hypothetical protein FQA47_006710 [Oryzias melastigma]|uniref:Uncharacterized protein n=1 Tax=Oryzias melastigma TaxID=30732 RepID=A0A834FF53_ORYME|nr:hypothetical protein FQA47_006710 [Oryzias melastigma]